MYVEYYRLRLLRGYCITCYHLSLSNPPMPTATCVWFVPGTVDPMED